MLENPNYYAVIPANVRYADITPNAKLLYGEITALTDKNGICTATNDYFSKLYNVSKVSISKWIKELTDNNFITNEIIYKEGTKEILNRYLRIVYDPIKEKFNTPIKEKFKDNNINININNINNNQDILLNNNTSNINNINNISPKRNIKENHPLKDDNIPEFILNEEDKELIPAYNLWMDYKKQKRQSYKSLLSKKIFFEDLKKFSNGDAETAMQIVKQSMRNNWAGIFELNSSKNKTKQPKTMDNYMKLKYEQLQKAKLKAEAQ